MVVNRNQLARKYVASLAETEKISITEAEKRIKDICGLIVSELQEGNTVKLHKFVTFEVKDRKAFTGTHPQTGEPMEYKATKVLHITPTKTLKKLFKRET